MKLVRTARIKLPNTELEVIKATIAAYTKAYNHVCQVGFDKKILNGITLHQKTYKDTREYLPSQLAISARTKAVETLKSLFAKRKKKTKWKLKACPQSKQQSIRLDKNSYSLFLKTNIVSILTLNGRIKIQLNIPEYYKQYFDSWKNKSADLLLDKKNRIWLHVVFEKEITDVKPNNNLIGIDRGIKNLAVTSNNKFYGGGKVKQTHKKHQELRNKLQAKGSKSAKRHLKKLSGKERRFRKDVNHVISKNIIKKLQPGDTIVLEDLIGIRNKRARKKLRTDLNNWSYYQLEQFLKYKAEEKGISIVYVDARYTSQRCCKCGNIDRKNRTSQSRFKCKKCGFQLNADLNASRNICNKYLDSTGYPDRVVVNQPIVSTEMLDTSLCL